MWTGVFSLSVVCLIIYIGEIVSIKSSGRIPQMLIVTILFLIGFWTIFPKDILERSSIITISKLMFSIILIDVGASIDLSDLFKNKKIFLISLFSVITIIISTVSIGWLFFNTKVILATLPSLTGTAVGAILINNSSIINGQPYYGSLSMAIFICHTIISFPIATIFLKHVVKKKIQEIDNQHYIQIKTDSKSIDSKNFRTSTFYLAILFILASIVEYLSSIFGINGAILQIFIGMMSNSFGLLDTHPLKKTNSEGLLNIAFLASLMYPLVTVDFSSFLDLLVIALPLNLFSMFSLILIWWIVSKKFQYSFYLSTVLGMNSFLGFPFNCILTYEAIKSETNLCDESLEISETLIPKMILASTFSVSIFTPFIASICIKMLFK